MTDKKMNLYILKHHTCFNNYGYRWLKDHLELWGVDHSELVFINDGATISPETCGKIAKAIEENLHTLLMSVCQRCEEPVCEDCCVPYDQFSQITETICRGCYDD